MFKILVELRDLAKKAGTLEEAKAEIKNLEERIKNLHEAIAYAKETRRDEIAEQNRKNLMDESRKKIRETEFASEIDLLKSRQQLEIDKKLHAQAVLMKKVLVESDQERIKAEVALDTYKKMDNKEERGKIVEFLGKSIDGLSQRQNVVVSGEYSERD